MLNVQAKNLLLPFAGLPKDLNQEEQECCEWGKVLGDTDWGSSLMATNEISTGIYLGKHQMFITLE